MELRGKLAADKITDEAITRIDKLKAKGIVPTLAVVRVGNREDDLSYERGIYKRFEKGGANVVTHELPIDVTQEELENKLTDLDNDHSVNGILMFRPLPKHLDENRARNLVSAIKDSDCMSDENFAHIFAGDNEGYPPCTPQAVIEIAHAYDISLKGKKVALIGRSLVVGKPLAMLLLKENATVTICHTKTEEMEKICKEADIICAAAGAAKMVNSDFVNPNQVIFDVGINVVDGKLCGDVDYETVSETVSAITPVPGGVGAVTTSVLLKHVVDAAEKMN